MHIYVIVMQINAIVMQIPPHLTQISTCFLGKTLKNVRQHFGENSLVSFLV